MSSANPLGPNEAVHTGYARVSRAPSFTRIPPDGSGAVLRLLLIAVLICIPPGRCAAQMENTGTKSPNTPVSQGKQQDNDTADAVEAENEPRGDVTVEGNHVLSVYQSIGVYTAQDRAQRIEERLLSAAGDRSVSPNDVRIVTRDAWSEILIGNLGILAVTDYDAKHAGRSRDDLAKEYATNIRNTIVLYRHEHSWRMLLRGVLYTIVTTLILLILLWLLRRLRYGVHDWLTKWFESASKAERKTARRVAALYIGSLLLGIGSILRWLLVLVLLEVYLTVVLGYFPYTREISVASTRWLFSQLNSLVKSGLNYLPNLLVIAVIVLVGNYLVRLLRAISDAIESGNLTIRGFYSDWAKPTEKLVRAVIIVLSIIIIFPYLPGAKSPAFQGISIFVGVLLSLGSSSAVANAVAGVILTYMRSFLLGDWVRIGDTTGEIVEKNLLVTRIRTPKEEIITLPNSTVMSAAVQNYSAKGREEGVIFHTTVTLGYDAPWRKVHQLLVDAALSTHEIQHQPAPFVLQTALNDFYVAYELNAYTVNPKHMPVIYSELHQNIQDKFNEAGVEICSPHFFAQRDGNAIAIPNQYIAPDYKAPAFRHDIVKTANCE